MKKKKIIIISIVVIALAVIIGLGVYLGPKMYRDYKEKKDYDELADYMNNVSEEEPKQIQQKTERMIKLEELHNQYEDVVAWVSIPDTNISYPVVQGDDNSYYLDHTYKKEYSARGSIFLDKDASFDRPSDNFLIYGHRNKNGAMFEDLIKYEKEDFYQNHKNIIFTTLKEDIEYEIIAAFRSRVYYKYEKDVFRYYYFVNAENEEAFNNFVSSAKRDSMYDTGISASYGDQLLTLSTCAYHTEDGRFAVVAKRKGLVQEENPENQEIPENNGEGQGEA